VELTLFFFVQGKDDRMHSSYAVKQRSLISQAMWFLMVYALLHIVWNASRGTSGERLAIDTMIVKPIVALINVLTPSVNATAAGSSILALGGGINISNGCEGTDALFLLMAAIIACPFAWRVRLIGMLYGISLIFSLNQIRILVLFYAYRNDKTWFDQLHHNVAPLALIAAASLFFLLWTMHHTARYGNVVAGT